MPKTICQKIVENYQAGFSQGKSTINQILTIKQILEYGIDTHHIFMDLKAVYDSICRTKLYETMKEFQIPNYLIIFVQLSMKKVQCRIQIKNDFSKIFEANNDFIKGTLMHTF